MPGVQWDKDRCSGPSPAPAPARPRSAKTPHAVHHAAREDLRRISTVLTNRVLFIPGSCEVLYFGVGPEKSPRSRRRRTSSLEVTGPRSNKLTSSWQEWC